MKDPTPHTLLISSEPSLTSLNRSKAEQTSKRPFSSGYGNVDAVEDLRSKKVRYQQQIPEQTLGTTGSSAETNISQPAGKALFPDFCRKLMSARHTKCSNDTCIGWLERSPPFEHMVYLDQGPGCFGTSQGSQDALALDDLLLSASAGTILQPIQRLQIAKILATAILSYHSTSWMKNCWRSNNITIYQQRQISLFSRMRVDPTIFVEVPVDSPQQQSTSSGVSSFEVPSVRNPTLFSLGVMMLELAFGKPLQAMLKPGDLKYPAMSSTERDWHAALRLSKEVGSGLGLKYSRMVEQCLLCAFGHGTELGNADLQNAVQRDIVNELDRLIEGFLFISLRG